MTLEILKQAQNDVNTSTVLSTVLEMVDITEQSKRNMMQETPSG